MRRALSCLAFLVALQLPSIAAATTVVLDAMTDPFPPNPCLPNSALPVIFNGPYCDGVACPPDPIVASCAGSGYTQQVGLAGVLGHVTRTASFSTALLLPASARVVPGSTLLDVSVTDPSGLDGISLSYSDDVQDWNLDLVTQGLGAFKVPLRGAISADHPLILRIVMSDYGTPTSAGGYAEINVPVTAPGDVLVPFASFLVSYAFDFNAVDAIGLAATECGSSGCSVDPLPPRSYALGPIELVSEGPTAARRVSWGDLKTRYR